MRSVCILRTGYVGLVTGACLAEMGNRVTCVDIDARRIRSLQAGEVPFYEPGLNELVQRNIVSKRLSFSSEYSVGISGADVIFLCLPTPSSPSGAADTRILRSAVESLAPLISPPYPVIVNKSTAPVGTCSLLKRLLQKNNLGLHSVQVVSNPEFLREGSAISDFMHPDRVVIGAQDSAAAASIESLYAPLDTTVLITDWKTSEMIKYASNAYLATKISFVNEVANVCELVGADVSQVTAGMGLDRRIGSSFLRPGVGYGGSCFPKDVLALTHVAVMHNMHPRLLRAVMEVNADQAKRVLHKLKGQLGDLDGALIGVWGIAYKPDTDDIREAPAIEIIRLLEQEGARVRAYDPVAMPKAAPNLPDVTMCSDAYDAAVGADAVLLLTEWKEFESVDLHRVAASMSTPILIDGRNVIDQAKAESAGFRYTGVGRGTSTVAGFGRQERMQRAS